MSPLNITISMQKTAFQIVVVNAHESDLYGDGWKTNRARKTQVSIGRRAKSKNACAKHNIV